MPFRIYVDSDDDPHIVSSKAKMQDGWAILTPTEFKVKQEAYDFVHDQHPELIVSHSAHRWWDTECCFADEPKRETWLLSEYRQEEGGIERLCEVSDVCPLLNEFRACHGIVWCNIYNLGWTNSHNCTEEGMGKRWDLSDEQRRERELAMIAEAVRARRYKEKGL